MRSLTISRSTIGIAVGIVLVTVAAAFAVAPLTAAVEPLFSRLGPAPWSRTAPSPQPATQIAPAVGLTGVNPPADPSHPGLAVPPDASADDLSAEEVAGLVYIREEEKLAHDVYTALYEKWSLQTFANIAVSEQRHTDTVAYLLDSYGIEDPAKDEPGVFASAELQSLYDSLVSRGSTSLASAIEVGLLIEKVDIADLDERAAQTDRTDILQAYENLRSGSINHQRAFTRVYERQIGTPVPDPSL